MKYYIMPENASGNREVIPESIGIPSTLEGVQIINLPPALKGWLGVAGKKKLYPDYKVALAVAAGQIQGSDVFAPTTLD